MAKALLNKILPAIEEILYGICCIIFYPVRWLIVSWRFIFKIIQIIAFFFCLMLLGKLITNLPQPWQSYVIGALLIFKAVIFLSFIILYFWKPDKIDKLLEIIND